MTAFEILDLETGKKWIAYANWASEIEKNYPQIDWSRQWILGSK